MKIFIYTINHLDYSTGKLRCNGGGERYLEDLCHTFQEKGHEIYVFQAGSFKSVLHNNICFVGCPVDDPNIWKSDTLLIKYLNDKYWSKYFQKMIPDLKIFFRFDFYGNHENKTKSPTVGISHGVWFDGTFRESTLPRWKENFDYSVRGLDHIVSVDTNTINVLRSMYKDSINKKCHLIQNYVDTKKFFPINRTITKKMKVLFPRRLTHYRGIEEFKQSIKDIKSITDQIEFTICGSGDSEYIKTLKQELPDVNITNRNFDDMTSMYQEHDVVTIPSLSQEGTSLACLEGMACNCVPIVSNVGGLSDIVLNNYNGFMYKPGNLKDKILEVFNIHQTNPLRMLEIRKNVSDTIKLWNKDKWDKNWSNLIKSVT